MAILIKNVTLLSMSENRDKIEENKDILIEDNKIKEIGENIENHGALVIDAKGKILMPGLINTHAHVPMSLFRDTLDGYTLQQWLEDKIWPMEDRLTKEDIYYASALTYLEMIKTGTTTIHDMYFFADQIIQGAIDSGIRLKTTRTLMSLGGNGEERICELENLIHENKGIDRVSFDIGVHGFYTTDREYIEKCRIFAKKYELPIHIHFCENKGEVEDIKKIYGVTSPVDLLEEYFSDSSTILAHAVKLSEEEIERLEKLDVSVSHCPISNLKLGCGIANIPEMMKNNICVSLGTDGQGSGSSLDLFQQMKFAGLLQKGITEDPKEMDSYEILKMATINGARALKMDDMIGSIEEGKIADVILVDLENVLTQPKNDICSALVYNVNPSHIDTTIVDGKILMLDHKVTNIDEKELFSKCEEIIRRIGKGVL